MLCIEFVSTGRLFQIFVGQHVRFLVHLLANSRFGQNQSVEVRGSNQGVYTELSQYVQLLSLCKFAGLSFVALDLSFPVNDLSSNHDNAWHTSRWNRPMIGWNSKMAMVGDRNCSGFEGWKVAFQVRFFFH